MVWNQDRCTVDDKVQAQLNALEERLGTKLDSHNMAY